MHAAVAHVQALDDREPKRHAALDEGFMYRDARQWRDIRRRILEKGDTEKAGLRRVWD